MPQKRNTHACVIASNESVYKCQLPDSAGHPGKILTTHNGARCAKQTNTIEMDFYDYVKRMKASLLKHMPKLYTKCTHDGKRFVEFENLKRGMQAPIELDIKLGKHTADRGDLEAQGLSNFRIAYKIMFSAVVNTASGRRNTYFAPTRFNLTKKSRDPVAVFKAFFKDCTDPGVREGVLRDLKGCADAFRAMPPLRTVGVSVLMVYDQKRPSLPVQIKLIDFAHTVPVKNPHKSHAYTVAGIENMHNCIRDHVFGSK
jgi:hypothetical protein